jgi:hypothetical protein
MNPADKCAHLQGKPYCPDCCKDCIKAPGHIPCGVVCPVLYGREKCERKEKTNG